MPKVTICPKLQNVQMSKIDNVLHLEEEKYPDCFFSVGKFYRDF